MRYAPVTDRLMGKGADKWRVHFAARAMARAGREVIELTIGEPDVAVPQALVDRAVSAMQAGRTGYSSGRGEAGMLDALAARYSRRTGRAVTRENVMALPGTQTALYVVMATLAGPGDEVLVGDPMYATYDGVIAASGATLVPVPLRPAQGFRMQAEDVAARITPRTRVLFLNSPHNPTGAVLTPADLSALGDIARAHDLWIVSDEVYEEMVFPGTPFASPFDDAALADRTVVCASISKSHAAPGFRAGWAVGPAEFCDRALPLSESMLFGGQPFIADMTELAVSAPSPVAKGMAARFAARADLLVAALDGVGGLHVHRPQAGMFALVDVRGSGMTGEAFAMALLDATGVAVMPGESFGTGLAGWLRLSLTQPDAQMAEAARRIASFVQARAAA
jgi:arginine:pyruvate transaminase